MACQNTIHLVAAVLGKWVPLRSGSVHFHRGDCVGHSGADSCVGTREAIATINSLREPPQDKRAEWIYAAVTIAARAITDAPAPPKGNTTASTQRPEPPAADKTIVVMLGTGNPAIDPDRSGPATAIVVNGSAYLLDFGAGVVRRAKTAVLTRSIPALEPTNLRVVFATHLHSDHTVGYADLILTPWVMGRKTPLEVYGPKGIKAITANLLEAYRVDINARTSPDGMKLAFPGSYKVNAHEIGPGVICKDANVTVTAFASRHAVNPISTKTHVVMLGTGTPGPDPDRSGPATAIVVNDTPYLVDFGAGVVMPRVHQIDLTNFCGLLGELT